MAHRGLWLSWNPLPLDGMVEGGVHEPAPVSSLRAQAGAASLGGRAGPHTAVTPSALLLSVPCPPSAFSAQPLKQGDETSLPDPL